MSIPAPTYLFVTPYLQQMFQQETGRQLVHTYTRHPRTPIVVPGSEDNDWGQPQYTYPAPIPDQPCYYDQTSRPIIKPYGLLSKNVPTFYIPQGDPLDRGDYVSNIRTQGDPTKGIPSILLLDGPVEVEDTTPQAPAVGGAVFIQCSLRDIQIVPDGKAT